MKRRVTQRLEPRVIMSMNLRRLLPVVAISLLATLSFAQLTSSQKQEVLADVDRVLSKEAFVPGVDLGKWRDFVKEREELIDEADSPTEFAAVVNSAFKQFGLSHMQLVRERRRRGWGGGEAAQQGFRGFRVASLRWVEDDTAMIRLPSFSAGYDEDEITELFEQAKDAKYLLLDLRGNPGGEVENMRHFLGLLLPQGTSVGTFVSKSLATDFARTGKGETSDPVAIAKWARKEFRPRRTRIDPFKGQIAVLMDENSASASEIVANALRESKRSPLVGTRTAGAVLVSTFGRLSHGFRMQYPVGDYVSYGGIRLEGNPLRPDVSVRSSEAVEAALLRLKGRSSHAWMGMAALRFAW